MIVGVAPGMNARMPSDFCGARTPKLPTHIRFWRTSAIQRDDHPVSATTRASVSSLAPRNGLAASPGHSPSRAALVPAERVHGSGER